MRNPHKLFLNEFLNRSAGILLAVSLSISLLEFIVLYFAAKSEGVLVIENGVGLLRNYAVFSALFGDAFLLFIIKKYSDVYLSIEKIKTIPKSDIIFSEFENYRKMIRLDTRHKFALYMFIFVGISAWISNVTFHVLGQAETHWGSLVFDSTDHRISFILNRVNNFYSWVIILPLCVYIALIASTQLYTTLNAILKNASAKYDLLNPDRCGGFSFVGTAHVFYNFAVAIVYVQITIHIDTFEGANIEHILSYIFVTIIFIFGNSFFIAKLYKDIENLKFVCLEQYKEQIYGNNELSFHIYKYYHESFSTGAYTRKAISIINYTKAITVILPLAVRIMDKFI